MKIAYLILATIVSSVVLQSCGADGNHPGYEYMPYMYRSPSYDTYIDNLIFENGFTSLLRVKCSIPRGFILFEYDNSFLAILKSTMKTVADFG